MQKKIIKKMKNNEKFTIIFSTIMLICLFLLLPACERTVDHNLETQSISKEERLEWFKEVKFGMFIHWGPYAKLAGEWNSKKIPVGENAEWIIRKMANFLK